MRPVIITLSLAVVGMLYAQPTVLGTYTGVEGTFSGTTATYKDHPDPSGGVSPNYIVHGTGQTLVIFDKSMNVVQSVSMPTLFTNAGATISGIANEAYIFYDKFIGRWIATCDDTGGNGDYVLVSAGDDPRTSNGTTNWKLTTITKSGVNDDTLQPGYDRNGFYVTRYGGAAGGNHALLNVFSNSALSWVGAGSIGAASIADASVSFEAFPTVDTNPNKLSTDPELILYRTPNGQGNTGAYTLTLYTVTWSGGTPTLSAATNVTSGFNHNTPINSPQPSSGSIKGIESHRAAAFADWSGNVWVMMSGGNAGGTHNGFQWFKVRMSDLTIQDSGSVFGAMTDYLFSGVLVDSSQNVMFLATCTDASTFPSLCMFYHKSSDGAGVTNGPVTLASGAATYPGGCNAGTPPGWGLWNRGAVDPSDETKIWVFGEIGSHAVACDWQTTVVNLTFGPPSTTTMSGTVKLGGTVLVH